METEKKLSQLPGSSEEDLQVVSNKMKEYISTENEAVLEAIRKKLNERPGIIGTIFPSKVKKEFDKLTIQKMKSLFETRENMLSVYTNTQIELARLAGDKMIESKILQYDGELSKQGMQIKADLTEFAQLKINDMSDTFEKSRIPFGERRARQLKDADKYKDDEFYYNRLKQNLNTEAEVFFNTIEDLLIGFKDALKNRLAKS